MFQQPLKFKVAEKHIQKSILDYLRMRGYLVKRNNAGNLSATHNGKTRFINIGDSGWPDIEGIVKEGKHRGKYFGIEVKSRTGVLSESQVRVGGQIIKNGGIWFVARSVDEVIEKGF